VIHFRSSSWVLLDSIYFQAFSFSARTTAFDYSSGRQFETLSCKLVSRAYPNRLRSTQTNRLSPIRLLVAHLEVELQCKLNQPWVVVRRADAPEITGINNLTSTWINARGVEVADRVAEVDVVEQVEELSAELDRFRFTQHEALDDREVDVNLSGPTQDVTSDVAYVRALRARDGRTVRAWDRLTGLYDGPDEGQRVEEVSGRNVARRRVARRTGSPTGPSYCVSNKVRSEVK